MKWLNKGTSNFLILELLKNTKKHTVTSYTYVNIPHL